MDRSERAALRLVHDAGGLVVVDKPAGLATQPVRGGGHDDLVALLDGAHPLHRLDRATSGLCALARDAATAARLAPLFQSGGAHRRYVALVRGVPAAGAAGAGVELRHRLVHDTARRSSRIVLTGGQEAVLRYRVCEALADGRAALLEVTPLTGRTHQIRVQLAAAGHPVVGDRRYGGPPAERLMLHAAELALPLDASHPHATTTLRAPPPTDFETVLALWRRAASSAATKNAGADADAHAHADAGDADPDADADHGDATR
ncbi:MAG TPA: RNA pseudouridine synthase [Myxococcota bacterium]|jgi:23S rRNA-/tRNA-specific pseudouridylate synthase|nr:RNA pseudouridine synthase [Myxococcota bacterium]